MSHFVTLVFTPSKPSEDELAAVLQPFHEYECTGVDDQYVIDVDVTDEVEDLWNREVDACEKDGELRERYDDLFYVETGTAEFSFPKKEFVLLEGWKEVKVPQHKLSEAVGETKAKFAEDYGGWFQKEDGRWYDRTNPNKKWDWWMVGGRWTGYFAPDYDPKEDPAHQETCWLCHGTGKRRDMEVKNGCNGCGGTGVSTKWPTSWNAHSSDQCAIGDIDVDRIRTVSELRAAKKYDKVAEIVGDQEIPVWDDIRAKHSGDIDAAREEYHSNPIIAGIKEIDLWLDVDEFQCSRENYLRRAREQAIAPFSFIKDGNWYERGEMGWWGIVSNEGDKEEWDAQFNKMFDELPKDSWVTVVDCHI